MVKKTTNGRRITCFGFEPGLILADKYEIISQIGGGWEGEVYLLKECSTGVEHAAKFWYPHRNPSNRAVRFYARKLHKLRHCPILIQYHTQETILFEEFPVRFLVSEYVEGELLSAFLARQPGKRVSVFQGLHLLHALAAGIEKIHNLREYHGDLHDENVIVRRYGLSFDLKLVDMYHWGPARPQNIQDDVCNLIRIFYDAIGGQARYAKHPAVAKEICCGLKRTLILKKFRTAGQLRQHLETMQWD
ncbi:MAG TPA: serine/threonine protein kinase [Thermoguttaceae bacterium]|nr:serine/threonine protein kinase [Thermoguttaceae bacterium]